MFKNDKIKGEVFQAWSSFTTGSKKKRGHIHTWSDGEKSMISMEIDETEVINVNSGFIASELGVKIVEAYGVGQGEDVGGKAKLASPLEPGIAFV